MTLFLHTRLAVSKLMLRFVTALSLLMTTSFAYSESLAKLCPADLDFPCLVRHTPQGHAENYERWWTMCRAGCRKAWGCAAAGDVSNYLMIWSAEGLDGDLLEGVTQDTENLLIWKPTCFFEGALKLPSKARDQMVARFFPLFRPILVTQALREYQKYDHSQDLAKRLEANARDSEHEAKTQGLSAADESYPSNFIACR
jgi:hypothetical protein